MNWRVFHIVARQLSGFDLPAPGPARVGNRQFHKPNRLPDRYTNDAILKCPRAISAINKWNRSMYRLTDSTDWRGQRYATIDRDIRDGHISGGSTLILFYAKGFWVEGASILFMFLYLFNAVQYMHSCWRILPELLFKCLRTFFYIYKRPFYAYCCCSIN